MEFPRLMDRMCVQSSTNQAVQIHLPDSLVRPGPEIAPAEAECHQGTRQPYTRCIGGFTLVEVVIAVAIVAFALAAILGLVGLAVQGTRDADLSTRIALIDRRVVSDLQSRSFVAVTGSFVAITGTSLHVQSGTILGSTLTSYYDLYGTPYTDCFGNPKNPVPTTTGTYFRCDVIYATGTSPAPVLSSTNNAALLQVVIRYPYPALTGSNVSVTSIANYQ